MTDRNTGAGSPHKAIKESAVATKHAAQDTAVAAKSAMSSAERTTQLAMDRTIYAAERTYAAWVRTGLVALASGLGAEKLLQGTVPHWMILGAGTILILFSAFCFVAGIWRQLFTGSTDPAPDVKHMPKAVLLVVSGFLALVALTALTAVWFGRQ
jgi:putative membrane protein